MKKIILICSLFFSQVFLFAQAQTIDNIIKNFDTKIFNSASSDAEISIGFISYGDSETCGSVVPWFQSQIKQAVSKTRHLTVITSSDLKLEEQTIVTTRGAFGGVAVAKNTGTRKYILNGTYYEVGNNVELILELYDMENKLFASETAIIPMSEIKDRKLSLYPQNIELAEQVQKDFVNTESEIEEAKNNVIALPEDNPKEFKSLGNNSIVITAAMLDKEYNLVNVLYPQDIVQFMIATNKDSYIALLCIDANGMKSWLPIENNFIPAGEVRTFPDIANTVFKVVDGVYGAEQILVYASSSPKGLPNQQSSGCYKENDIQQITRGIVAVAQDESEEYETSVFKITYTVLPHSTQENSPDTERRNALLVANGSYSSLSDLEKPIPEAKDLMVALQELGFSVKLIENASREEMLDALVDFGKILEKQGGIGFFHYGGHAVQVKEKNYLIPSTADIEDESRVAARAVDLDEVMTSMVADTNIVVLDSCRDNPLPASSSRSVSRGLVASKIKPENSIVVYSAQAGSVALDGVFTPVFTKKILQKDKSLTDILIDVRNEVYEKTDRKQVPGEYGQLMKQVYLAGKTKIVEDSIVLVEAKTTVKAVTAPMRITSEMAGDVYLDNVKTGSIKAYGLWETECPVGLTTVEIRGLEETLKKSVVVKEGETTVVEFKKTVEKTEEPKPVVIQKPFLTGEISGSVQIAPEKKEKKPSIFKLGEDKLTGIHFWLGTYYNYSLFDVFDLVSFASSPMSLGARMSLVNVYIGGFEVFLSHGYTYTQSGIDKHEYTFHEFEPAMIQLGFNLGRFAFRSGASYVMQWEVLKPEQNVNGFAGGKSLHLGIGIPTDVLFRLGNKAALFAEYKPVIFPSDAIFRQSFNTGIMVNLFY